MLTHTYSYRKHLFDWQRYVPQSVACLKAGYSWKAFYADLVAGVGTGVLALPLNMAFAIACGLPPEVGLYTAVVAGFLCSLLGGTLVAIGGPTGAFVVIIYSIIQRHGVDGLAMATFMAGAILVLMGLARCGAVLKFVSSPVIAGFTAGIAVVLMSLQVKELLGLQAQAESARFLDVCKANLSCLHTLSLFAVATAIGSVALILSIRRVLPRAPVYLLAVLAASAAVAWFELPVQTIGSKFGDVPSSLPIPRFPLFEVDRIRALLPEAFTIALLSGLESLLCALVADEMRGTRHKSDCELVAQGVGNMGSVLFSGIPCTGAIARTAANIRMGAQTPVAGMIHALVMLLLMLFFAPYAKLIPLPALSAILFVVAWQMSQFGRLGEIVKTSWRHGLVLMTTFLLTVFVDLTIAVPVGIGVDLSFGFFCPKRRTITHY